MAIPGFTADLSLVRSGSHGQLAAQSRVTSRAVQPALEVSYQHVCWCAEEGMCEVKTWYQRFLGIGGHLVECCVRRECVDIPIFR